MPPPKESKVVKRDIGGWTQFCLLQARDLYVFVGEEVFEFLFRSVETVCIELEDFGRELRSWRTRAKRARVAMDVVGEEEKEEEESGEGFDGLFMPAGIRRRHAGRERRRGMGGWLGV